MSLRSSAVHDLAKVFDPPRGRFYAGWNAFEDMSLKMGFRPDAGLQHLFSKFANENTGSRHPLALQLGNTTINICMYVCMQHTCVHVYVH